MDFQSSNKGFGKSSLWQTNLDNYRSFCVLIFTAERKASENTFRFHSLFKNINSRSLPWIHLKIILHHTYYFYQYTFEMCKVGHYIMSLMSFVLACHRKTHRNQRNLHTAIQLTSYQHDYLAPLSTFIVFETHTHTHTLPEATSSFLDINWSSIQSLI